MVYWSLQNLTDTIGGMVVDSQEPSALVGLIGPRRKALGLSMQKAAELAGVHRLTWRTWEQGAAQPADYNLSAIDKALRLQPGTAAAAVAGEPFFVPEPAPPRERPGAPWQSYRVTAAEALELLQVALDDYGPGGFWKAFDEIESGRATDRAVRNSVSNRTDQTA